MGGAAPSRQLAGRTEEQRLLGEAVESAVDGVPSAAFVHGEAGSGKTYLVSAICDQAVQEGCAVLWGRCVHFGAVESPYLPFVSALEGWIETAEPDEREAVLTAVDGVGELLPSLGRRASDGPVRLPSVLDGLVRASDAWRTASLRCEAAGMRWEQAIASWRWAQALLAEDADPSAAAVPLRSAHRFAAEEGAALLLRDIEALATSCRIRLDEPAQPTRPDTESAPFNTLTKREHEVLSYLVAGRTYAEIADALFISNKTVSAHVSNLLRKTGTTSRREVSALALRTSQSPTAPDQG